MMRWFARSGAGFFTFRKKLILSYLVIVFIPLVGLTFFYFSKGSQMIEKLAISTAERSLEQTKAYVSSKLEFENVIADMMTVNNEVFSILSKETGSYSLSDQLDDAKKLESFIDNVLDHNGDIYKIRLYVDQSLIFANENVVLFGLRTLENTPWLQKVQAHKGNLVWTLKMSGNTPVLSAARYIQNFRGSGGSDVLVEIQVKSERIRQIIENGLVFPNGSYVLVDAEGAVMFSSSDEAEQRWGEAAAFFREQTGSYFHYGDRLDSELIVMQKPIDFLGWRLFFMFPMQEILKQNQKFKNLTIITMISVSFIILSLAYSFSGYNAKRLERLNAKMDKINGGHLDVLLIPNSGNDEIGRLEKSFNYMVESIKAHLSKETQMNRSIRNSEMKALQSQINPHFLYNTLEMINWMIDLKQNDEARRAVLSLAAFYKISLFKGEDMITIREEIEHVKMYVAIQNMRFDDRIRLRTDIDPETVECRIVKILLQPIVENSIVHGIFPKASKTGEITIRCAKKEGRIEITVTDDGIGMDQDKIDKLLDLEHKHAGYGIRNVRERLLLHYGSECDLEVESVAGVGTTFRFHVIPHV
ncbi:MAG: sensor histidine kinase [Cohnella sp.]|nr:sensor histidine kinase [Cohnella sp.]